MANIPTEQCKGECFEAYTDTVCPVHGNHSSKPANRNVPQRVTEYLSAGGLWNPELMDHEAVRALLIDARDVIEIMERERRAPETSGECCGWREAYQRVAGGPDGLLKQLETERRRRIAAEVNYNPDGSIKTVSVKCKKHGRYEIAITDKFIGNCPVCDLPMERVAEETTVRAEDVRSLRLQWGLSCSHECPSCDALDRALMRLTGDLPEKASAPFDRRRFENDPPCYLCGYNGPGYFAPAIHACARQYHAENGKGDV